MRRVAYLTDAEGRWEKLAEFCRDHPLVHLTDAGVLTVSDSAVFVFGGDAIDRGPSGRKLMRVLLDAKRASPDRVVLLAGNRDINKLRLVRELTGFPNERIPAEIREGSRTELLRFIFSRTMGARDAFGHRRAELSNEGRPSGDEDVVESYLEDLAPSGPMTAYLSELELAHREDDTLFVHGGVTAENLGVVPNRPDRVRDVDAWVRELNAFYTTSMKAFAERRHGPDGEPLWANLVRYQAPLPGTRLNQTSVVYARPTNDIGDPMLPAEWVVNELCESGIRRVIVGHTPSGDCPTLLTDRQGFELVLADNSYGRIEGGARVGIDQGVLRIQGTTELDSGERERVDFEAHPTDDRSPLGLRDVRTGRLVKARLARGDYLGYRSLGEYRVEQVALTEEEISRASLVAPR